MPDVGGGASRLFSHVHLLLNPFFICLSPYTEQMNCYVLNWSTSAIGTGLSLPGGGAGPLCLKGLHLPTPFHFLLLTHLPRVSWRQGKVKSIWQMQLCLSLPSAASLSEKTTNLDYRRWGMRRGSITYTTELCKPKASVMSMLYQSPEEGHWAFMQLVIKQHLESFNFFSCMYRRLGQQTGQWIPSTCLLEVMFDYHQPQYVAPCRHTRSGSCDGS